jgi:hemolysin III
MVGAVLSVALLVALLVLAHGRVWHTVAFTIYGASLILLYSASAFYHSVPVRKSAEAWLQRFDYIAIFFLIAGTYTPVCLLALRGRGGLVILAIEWALALFGVLGILFWKNAPHWIRVTLYIAMGWLAVAAWPQMRAVLPPAALGWILTGGLFYTGGIVFYALDRPLAWPGWLSTHDLWHLFVMGGSACHAVAILRFLALP